MTLSAFLQATSLPSKIVVLVSRLYAIATIEPQYRNFGKLWRSLYHCHDNSNKCSLCA